jgi:hypothetical protein
MGHGEGVWLFVVIERCGIDGPAEWRPEVCREVLWMMTCVLDEL